ncbi:hypothetical protein CES87_16100 [Pseudomonas sp. ERMR1:02]|nr:hypothetical protein CES87_16100 [Pseudomonas sp. ERMR1:02]
MVFNDDGGSLTPRVVLRFIASELAPTGGLGVAIKKGDSCEGVAFDFTAVETYSDSLYAIT